MSRLDLRIYAILQQATIPRKPPRGGEGNGARSPVPHRDSCRLRIRNLAKDALSRVRWQFRRTLADFAILIVGAMPGFYRVSPNKRSGDAMSVRFIPF